MKSKTSKITVIFWICNFAKILSISATVEQKNVKQTEYKIFVNEVNADLHHFWESTGLCPPRPHQNASDFLLSEDMKQNLLLISSVPHHGIKRVRVHWLLDLIKLQKQNYCFDRLDNFVKLMHYNELYFGFELMGNPGNKFTDFDNMTQVLEWQDLVTMLAKRYISMFGVNYVKPWLFETWNEPDHKDFDVVKMSVTGFLKYYDACSEGIKKASQLLSFGGPGASCRSEKFSKRCWALFEHCTNGTNYITGKKGSRLDFISFHKKGHSDSTSILSAELETINKIHTEYKTLTKTPIINDEADPLVGWNKPLHWRADVTYAALVTKVIAEHQHQIIANKSRSGINYHLLSNDNAFLSYAPHFFTQRTLNARFQVNNTDPKYVFLVKKPVLTVMGLLSKLGNVQLKQVIKYNQQQSRIGGISSVCMDCKTTEISTIIYNSENVQVSENITKLKIEYNTAENTPLKQFKPYGNDTIRHMFCKIDNVLTNPYRVWQAAGNLSFPTPAVFAKLQIASESHCTEPEPLTTTNFNLDLRLPSVVLHQICWKPAKQLHSPSKLHLHKVSNNIVLLKWSDSKITTKCIMTYNVEFAKDGRNFQTVNTFKVLFNSFAHIACSDGCVSNTVFGSYRVQAFDFWGRPGQYSKVVKHKSK
ncbi:alpha-L-iduronidase-like [Ciona intestinalis]